MPDDQPLPFVSWLDGMARAYGYARDADVARGLGLPQSTVSRWRRGARPSVEHLMKIAKTFRTDLVSLLALTGHVGPDFVHDTELPERPPQDPGERVIQEAELPDEAKEAFSRFWRSRLDEEKQRLETLLSTVVAWADASPNERERLALRVFDLTQSHLRDDVLTCLTEIARPETEDEHGREEGQEAANSRKSRWQAI